MRGASLLQYYFLTRCETSGIVPEIYAVPESEDLGVISVLSDDGLRSG